MKRTLLSLLLVGSVSTAVFAGCNNDAIPDPSKMKPATTATATSSAPAATASVALPPMPKADPLAPTPKGLPDVKAPENNPISAERAALGKQLFFDKRLSKDGSTSCETCHVPEKGWTDGEVLSTKVGGAKAARHSPTMMNVAYNNVFYWDGRAETMEKNITAAWKGNMGAEDQAALAAKLNTIPGYLVQFKTVFGSEATPETVVKALATFVRTILNGDSAWDKAEAGDKKAVGDDEKKGFELFRNKAGCAACHAPPLYTDLDFHNVGIGMDAKEPDTGRGKITKDTKDDGKFKTPSLRSVGLHPPYLHNGSAATLEAAVDVMLSGGTKNANLDARMKKVTLTGPEKKQLMAFLKSLESPITAYPRPTLPQ
jgi:cytochrome c peroxidase